VAVNVSIEVIFARKSSTNCGLTEKTKINCLNNNFCDYLALRIALNTASTVSYIHPHDFS
jgi:hypothetical protein